MVYMCEKGSYSKECDCSDYCEHIPTEYEMFCSKHEAWVGKDEYADSEECLYISTKGDECTNECKKNAIVKCNVQCLLDNTNCQLLSTLYYIHEMVGYTIWNETQIKSLLEEKFNEYTNDTNAESVNIQWLLVIIDIMRNLKSDSTSVIVYNEKKHDIFLKLRYCL